MRLPSENHCTNLFMKSGLVRMAFASLVAAITLQTTPAHAWQAPAKPSSPTTPAAPPASGEQATAPRGSTTVDVKWLERLPKEDRTAIDAIVGYAPPAIPTDLKWIGNQALTWSDVRGKVVVVQSFTTATMAGRKWPERVAAELKESPTSDLRIIALHTPEGAAKAEDFLAKQPPPANVTVAIDSKGEFCDAFGIYKQPVNFVIDRNGMIRYAGLNPNGVQQAVTALLAEPFNAKIFGSPKPADVASPSNADFPPITGSVSSAKDIRGQRAPDLFVANWLTNKPNTTNRVVVIDYWATWCGPCVAAIPHMNELQTHFGDKITCIGISDEKPDDFEKGLMKLKSKDITLKTFKYALGLDPSSKMKSVIQIRGIPHCIVMSKDWIVRWQGHPAALTADTLAQIVAADSGATKPGAKKARGWQNS